VKSFFKKKYRKIPKISPGDYIFQRPFLRGLFLEGLIFEGAYLRSEIYVSNSIGLALKLKFTVFALFYFVLLCINFLRAIFRVQGTSPPPPRGGLILGGTI